MIFKLAKDLQFVKTVLKLSIKSVINSHFAMHNSKQMCPNCISSVHIKITLINILTMNMIMIISIIKSFVMKFHILAKLIPPKKL